MLAILWLLLCLLLGAGLRRRFLPSLDVLFAFAYRDKGKGLQNKSTGNPELFPRLFFELPAALLLGIIPLTTLLYFVATACRALGLQLHGSSLLAANGLLGPVTFILIIGAWLIKRRRVSKSCGPQSANWLADAGPYRQNPPADSSSWDVKDKFSLSLPGRLRRAWPYAAAFLFLAWLCYSLHYSVFYLQGSLLHAGSTVASDYAPHLATISSFTRGENFAPSDYPFFASAGMRYHFFFFFFSANLHSLGLSLPAALNLASSLGLLCFSSLMGVLAVAFSGRRQAFFWIQPLLYWQSSFSGFFFLRESWQRAQDEGRSIFELIAENTRFIGRLPNDNWGLWSVNVYANQRHLLFGLAAALLVLICVFPSLTETRNALRQRACGWRKLGHGLRKNWFRRSAWLSSNTDTRRPFAAALLLLVCLPYWHGAVTVALLLMLFICALPAQNKLLFLTLGTGSLIAVFAFERYFSRGGPAIVQVLFRWGFICEDKSLLGILRYCAELLGLAFPAFILLPWLMRGRLRRTLAFASVMPFVFAFTVSLTPDITVNHKYIIIARLLLCLPLITLLSRLWHLKPAPLYQRLAGGALALVLGFLLVFSGFLDQLAYGQANRYPYAIDIASPFERWLEEETEARAVFLTPTWFYHPFFYSGRQAWFGYPYYAWSAGYDTYKREAEAKILWSGGGGEQQRFNELVTQYHLRYALIDDELRRLEAGNLDEAFFVQHFPLVGEYPELGNLKVYELR